MNRLPFGSAVCKPLHIMLHSPTKEGNMPNIKPVNSEEALRMIAALSKEWEAENSTYGFVADDVPFLRENRCFAAYGEADEIIGYLFGKAEAAKRMRSVVPDDTPYFEVEELYVRPGYRSRGVGRALMAYPEDTLRAEGITHIFLSAATKAYKRTLHFYIDELGMEFWSARLFKKL